MVSLCEPNYPERLKHIFCIRAPWIFTSLYAMIKPMLNPGTAEKVIILGEDFMPCLLKYMPESVIPKYLGGLAEDTCPAGGIVPKDAMDAIKSRPSQSRTAPIVPSLNLPVGAL